MKLSSLKKIVAGVAVLSALATINPTASAEEPTVTQPQPGAATSRQPRIAQIAPDTPAAPRAPAATPSAERLIDALNRAEADMNGDALIFAYGQSVTDPLMARAALAQLMFDYYGLRSRATSAMQASQAVDEAILRFSVMHAAQNQVTVQQNQVIIDQNQRIIALLEQIAKK